MTGEEPPAAEVQLVQDEIDRHARLAYDLAGDEGSIMGTYGAEDWAKARWHLHVAETLRCMSHTQAIAVVRERAMRAMQRQAEQAKQAGPAALPRWTAGTGR